MAVARDHLRRNRGGLQTEAAADALFRFWADMAEGANRARELADAHLGRSQTEAIAVAAQFVVPEGDLQAKGNRLGVNAVGTADLDSVLEFIRAALQDGK